MATNKNFNLFYYPGLLLVYAFFIITISSCGKQGNASPTGLNVQYEILNLSPDLFPVNLYINNLKVNASPIIFGLNTGYFYVPSIDTPYQIRTTLIIGNTIFSRHDILKPGVKYSLFISGSNSNGSLKQVFTVDTISTPPIGRGRVRFLNVSPSTTTGLDVYANDTLAFKNVAYTTISKYLELPVGSYNFGINSTGSSSTLKTLPGITIQDGRLYTLYAYGYTNRIDSAAFNAALITNR